MRSRTINWMTQELTPLVVEGFPGDTHLYGPQRMTDRDGVAIALITAYRDGPYLVSTVEIAPTPSAMSSDRRLLTEIQRALALLRQRHHFHLAYDRGGYC